MTTVSIRLPDELLKETESRAKVLHISRAEYIRRAIAAMNHEMLALKRRERLMRVSQRVSTVKHESDLLIDQLRAIDNRRLSDGPLMRCDEQLMARVHAAIRDLLEM